MSLQNIRSYQVHDRQRVQLSPFRPDLEQELFRFRLRFPLERPSVTQDMEKYLSGTHHISLKQVPSALAIKKAGSSSVSKNRPVLLDAGFQIEEYYSDGKRKFYQKSDDEEKEVPDPYRPSSNIASLLGLNDEETENGTEVPDLFSDIEKTEESEFKNVTPKNVKKYSRLVYGDFFRILAGRFLKDIKGEVPPRVLVWSADVKRLVDPLRPDIFRWEKFGLKCPKNPIRFQDIKNVDVQMDFLYSHTHWGFKLKQLCVEDDANENHRQTTHTLKKVLRAFLQGDPDPRWTNAFTDCVYVSREKRNHANRSKRLLEVLKTIDGVFAQRFCAFPHEDWTYEKYDVFVLKLLWEMISDEFLDGELTEYGRNFITRYSDLKSMRGEFKYAASRGTVDLISECDLLKRDARWLRFMLPCYTAYRHEQDRIRRLFLHGILSQTRGAGKPPPLCKLQAKVKFLKTVTSPDDISSNNLKIIKTCIGEILQEIPDHIFTGLSTKGGITVNNAACFEYTQGEGGTLKAIQDICKKRELGIHVQKYDLETGKPDGFTDSETNPGTYIFWSCLHEVLCLSPEERSEAQLVVIDEPGKNRAITKARACLKVVLDWVNKICAVPLAKGFASSQSGMEKANHAWNLFRDASQAPLKDLLFKVREQRKEPYNGQLRMTRVYETVFAVSTDYETATDYQSHRVGKIIGYAWMLKCGIPRILRNLVCEVAFRPRTIYYYGNVGIGEEVNSTDNLWKVTTSRGVLMGDPLTKVILHFDNIIARRLSYRLLQVDFYEKVYGANGIIYFEALKRELTELGFDLKLLPKGHSPL